VCFQAIDRGAVFDSSQQEKEGDGPEGANLKKSEGTQKTHGRKKEGGGGERNPSVKGGVRAVVGERTPFPTKKKGGGKAQ